MVTVSVSRRIGVNAKKRQTDQLVHPHRKRNGTVIVGGWEDPLEPPS